eukprot:365569-Chlamydomonas_euryale.AAC.9
MSSGMGTRCTSCGSAGRPGTAGLAVSADVATDTGTAALGPKLAPCMATPCTAAATSGRMTGSVFDRTVRGSVRDVDVTPGMLLEPPSTVPSVPLRPGFFAFSSFQISSIVFLSPDISALVQLSACIWRLMSKIWEQGAGQKAWREAFVGPSIACSEHGCVGPSDNEAHASIQCHKLCMIGTRISFQVSVSAPAASPGVPRGTSMLELYKRRAE